MSHYDCVLPVDWERLNVTLQAWLWVLAGKMTLADYLAQHAPQGSDYVEADDVKQAEIICSEDYLRFFLERSYEDWLTVDFWQDGKRDLQQRILEKVFGPDEVLITAIKQSASFELAGDDAFSDEIFSYYGRLHDAPHVQVAGTKNAYHFLNSLFEGSRRNNLPQKIRNQHIYIHPRKDDWPELVQYLLEKLFLGIRCLPGVGILRLPPSTRGDDCPQFMGFLNPTEVTQLSQFEPLLTQAAELSNDLLFPLFMDRLGRSHECGSGLIAIQSGL